MYKSLFLVSIYFAILSICQGAAKSEERIINGKNAIKSEFPWIAGMVASRTSEHRCGGVIINENWVLTAAHCVVNASPSSYQIIAGDHDISDSDSSKQRRDISEFIVHPNYIGSTLNKAYDFALMRISTPLQLTTDTVKKINLPRNSDVAASDSLMTVAGWGLTSVRPQKVPDILQKLNLTIVAHQMCKDIYESYPDTPVEFTDQMFCAGDQWGSPCNGDSGSGFVQITRDPNTQCKIHVLYGIVSFGSANCNGGFRTPAVFGFVPSIVDWIQTNTGEQGPANPISTTCGIEDNPDDDDDDSSSTILNINFGLIFCTLGLTLHKIL